MKKNLLLIGGMLLVVANLTLSSCDDSGDPEPSASDSTETTTDNTTDNTTNNSTEPQYAQNNQEADFEGYVQDVNGDDVSGASVAISFFNGSAWVSIGSTTTDSQGQFALTLTTDYLVGIGLEDDHDVTAEVVFGELSADQEVTFNSSDATANFGTITLIE